MYEDAIIPRSASHPGEIIGRIIEWAAKVKELAKEESITIDPMIMMATLTEICTPDIRDMIYQQGDEIFKNREKSDMTAYKTIKDKIISWTSNRVASAAQMDIGNLQYGNQTRNIGKKPTRAKAANPSGKTTQPR